MKQQKRANMLLVELMIVILFFALSVSVLIQMLSGAHRLSETAGVETEALSVAQNVADELKAASDKQAYLADSGFALDGDRFVLDTGEYTVVVTLGEETETGGGILAANTVSVEYGESILFALDCTQYTEVTP